MQGQPRARYHAQGASTISGVGESRVRTCLNNLSPSGMAGFGKALPGPGKKKWFDVLPPDLQAYLNSPNISKDKQGAHKAPQTGVFPAMNFA